MIPWEGAARVSGSGTAAKAMGFLVAATWLASVLATGRFRRPGPFLAAAALFVTWNAFSVLWSADPSGALGQVLTWVQALVLGVVLWDLYRSATDLLHGLQAYVLGAYVAIGGAVVNYLAANPFYSHYERFSPGQTNPDGFGFVVALGLPVAWYLAGSPSADAMRRFRALNYAYVPAAFVGLALSGTRTATIAAAAGSVFGLVYLTRLRLRERVAVMALVAVAIYALIPFVQPLRSFERLSTTGTELTQGNWNGRLDQWRQGLASFVEHPILGVGTNQYRGVNSLGKEAHNSFLSVLAEVGLVGLALFGLVLALVVRAAVAHPPWDRTFWLSVILVWAIGASSLTWEHRKTTWLFLTLAVASAALHADGPRSARLHAARHRSPEPALVP